MYRKFFSELLTSGHTFEKDEVLLKFQYRVLNTVLIVVALFSMLFAVLSSLGIDPIGFIQTAVNFFVVVFSVLIMIRLRIKKDNYIQNAYLMYFTTFISFTSALLFVPQDEFRIIWFYLLIFSAYITGGLLAGNIVSISSITVVIMADIFYDLNLSETAIFSSVIGLVIASLLIRAYTKKIIDFELETIEQKQLMIAQSRLAAMGEMMSMIAHQWRQPLSTTTLMIANEKIKLMLEGKEPSECDKILDNISDTLVYLSDTVDDFQTYFKPDKASENIKVATFLERVVHLVEPRLKIAKVQMDVEEISDEEVEIYVNEVIQVFINIINNAVDILQERAIKEPHIWISIKNGDTDITIIVEDNGGGISDEMVNKVFEPYFSAKSKNGTGLGLYMAKMIIDKHIGGMLSVRNTQRGAAFCIVLPKKIYIQQ